MTLTALVLNLKKWCSRTFFDKDARGISKCFAGLYFWICFIRLPATSLRDSNPQSWEAVLSFASAHHLQWGRDVIFTFGPLGFLSSDYYWGNFFWPILFWGLGFSLLLATLLVGLCNRLSAPLRIVVFVAAPLLTVPSCMDLGFDPIYFLAIMLTAIACLPHENPGPARSISSGVFFAAVSSIKFTFSLYCLFSLFLLALVSFRAKNWRNLATIFASCLAAFFSICLWTGQSLGNVALNFQQSAKVASGYSSAMTIGPNPADLGFGLALIVCVLSLLLLHWLRTQDWALLDRTFVIGAAVFLAWKEGFVRPDVHVVVFLLFCFFMVALLPAIYSNAQDSSSAAAATPSSNGFFACSFSLTSRTLYLLTAATLLVAMAPFALHRKDFVVAVEQGFLPRFTDTFTAIFAPTTFKSRLEAEMESRRNQVLLPKINARLGGARVAVMNYDQDVAILNRMNYVPHPAFQNYSAYTPELQQLNQDFFVSSTAPEYVLWRFGTIDARFPTLDDGSSLLRILSDYSPLLQEGRFVLWKRCVAPSSPLPLGEHHEVTAMLDQWVSVPTEPTWLRIEFRPSLLGKLQDFLYSSSEARMEVLLQDGNQERYRLPSGNARSGFVINPFLRGDLDLLGVGSKTSIVAVRVYSPNRWFFLRSVRFVCQPIQGLAALKLQSTQKETKFAVAKVP